MRTEAAAARPRHDVNEGASAAEPGAVEGDGFVMLLRSGLERRRLIVVLSPRVDHFILFRRAFREDVLFVADRRAAYFIWSATALHAAIDRVIERGGYEDMLLVGSSKSGFGALLVGGLLARSRPSRRFRILTFSPTVRLWPYDPVWPVRSYHLVHRRACGTLFRRWRIRRHGDASRAGERPNVIVRAVYPERRPHDRAQAAALSGQNVALIGVPTRAHNTMAFVQMAHSPEDELREIVARTLLKDAAEDEEAPSMSADEAFAEVVSAREVPSLDELIAEAFAADPAPRRGPESACRGAGDAGTFRSVRAKVPAGRIVRRRQAGHLLRP